MDFPPFVMVYHKQTKSPIHAEPKHNLAPFGSGTNYSILFQLGACPLMLLLRQSFFEMVKGFEGSLEYIQHDYEKLNFIPAGDYLIVEGTSHGKISGKSWSGGKTPGGRFCNVFKFRNARIASLHIYLDPDYTGEDDSRFRWGKNRHW